MNRDEKTRFRKALGARLRALREMRGLTVTEVAALTGGDHAVNPERLVALEAGERHADFIELLDLLRIYGEREDAFRRDVKALLPD